MRKISVMCHGEMKQRVLHKTQTGRFYTMERKSGGGTKRKYVYPKQ